MVVVVGLWLSGYSTMSLLLDFDMYTHNISGGITAHFRGDIHINFFVSFRDFNLTLAYKYKFIHVYNFDNECLTEYTLKYMYSKNKNLKHLGSDIHVHIPIHMICFLIAVYNL